MPFVRSKFFGKTGQRGYASFGKPLHCRSRISLPNCLLKQTNETKPFHKGRKFRGAFSARANQRRGMYEWQHQHWPAFARSATGNEHMTASLRYAHGGGKKGPCAIATGHNNLGGETLENRSEIPAATFSCPVPLGNLTFIGCGTQQRVRHYPGIDATLFHVASQKFPAWPNERQTNTRLFIARIETQEHDRSFFDQPR